MKRTLIILSVLVLILVGNNAASAAQLWGTGSPAWGSGSSGPSPVIFMFETSTGQINRTTTFDSYNWMWISGLADGGKYLYASHNTYNTDPLTNRDTHDFKIAKINKSTGAVLSDTSVAAFLDQDLSQVNALDFHEGRLYAVENATSGSTIRGYAVQVLLDLDGDVIGAIKGAYVGDYPDCGLDFHNGLWYATSWGYTPGGLEGSIVYTSPDIMTTSFTQVGTGNSAVEGMGMINGWEFDDGGNLFAVTWYSVPNSATAVYRINTTTWQATLLNDLASQLPTTIISLDGLSEVIPLYSCSGFEAPCNSGPIKVKKNRVIPLKAQLFDSNGQLITPTDISDPPVVQVIYQSGTSPATDMTSEALAAGQGTVGNQFVFHDGKWQFNLETKNYTAKGTYTVRIESGDATAYGISPTCIMIFVIE